MKNYICIDGVKTKLSCETAESLKQRFGTEKPKELRHGDCGCNKDGNGWVHIIDKTYWSHGSPPSSCPNSSFIESRLSNLFDDLERNSKDLEEFEIDNKDGDRAAKATLSRYITLWTGARGDKRCHTFALSQAQEFHQKLGQLIATAKRKAEKDC